MVRIIKKWEPKELSNFKKLKNSSYATLSGSEKEAVYESLCSEQFGLCAYCMTRIFPDEMRIEHFLPQSDEDLGKSKSLEYKNMLGVCDGGEKFNKENDLKGKENLSCDAYKGNKSLSLNPSIQTDFEKMKIYYGSNGKIHSENKDFEEELNDVLNLNVLRLVNQRKAAKMKVIEFLFKNKNLTDKQKKEKLQNLRTPKSGLLDAFFDVSSYFFEKFAMEK